MNALLLQLSMATGVATWALLLYLSWSWLREGGFRRTFTALAAVHLFRFIGLIALVPTHFDPTPFGFTQTYLMQVAWGDYAANILAILAILAVQRGWASARFLAWAFVLVGTADTANAGAQMAVNIHDQNLVGALGWLILTIYVPALIVTEVATFYLLVKSAPQAVPRMARATAMMMLLAVMMPGADEKNSEVFADKGLAIRGYDVVAYFTDSKPVKGEERFTQQWKGVTWRFASEEHRRMFVASPEKYEPQYGGYCAWGMSNGYKAPIDPTAWKIVEGKLYLNYNSGVQQKWLADVPGLVKKADALWPNVKLQPAK
jgi:YHS domain-containing protein